MKKWWSWQRKFDVKRNEFQISDQYFSGRGKKGFCNSELCARDFAVQPKLQS